MMMSRLGPADVGLGPDSGAGLNIQIKVKESSCNGQRNEAQRAEIGVSTHPYPLWDPNAYVWQPI